MFSGKVALITGGTAGIGRATAVAFAERGANVVVAGRREAEGAETVALIQKAGSSGLFVQTDVAVESEIAALVARTQEHFGRLDFAFNNAGVGGEGRGGISAPEEVYDHIMNINTRGVFFSMKHQIPAMLRPGLGLVVSPLIALMTDQVAALTQSGVAAARLDSNVDPDEKQETWRRIERGELDLLYV